MKPNIFEEKTKELDLDVFKIIKLLKDVRSITPEFLNGVLIDFNTFYVLMEELRHLRHGIEHLNHIFIMIRGTEAEKRTNDFMLKLVKGDIVIPALEGKK